MQDTEIKNNILNKIKKDEVKMTPKQFFILKWLGLLLMSVFFLFFGFYILAYVIFLFVDNGLVYMPLFSESGIVDFIVEIPWTLVLIGIFSVFLFSITSKTFYKLYRKPFLTFFFSILMIIILSQLILSLSGGLQYIKEEAFKEKIQLVPRKFLEFRDSQTGTLLVGYVVSTTTDSLIVRDRKSNLIELFVGKDLALNSFLTGQLINAYGKRDNEKFFVKSIEIVR